MHREITDVEASARGLVADEIVRHDDGTLTFRCDVPLVEWTLVEHLHPNPPLPAFYGVVP